MGVSPLVFFIYRPFIATFEKPFPGVLGRSKPEEVDSSQFAKNFVNLDSFARTNRREDLFVGSRSPLLDPMECNEYISENHSQRGIQWSYGGYLEDRSALWRGSYLERLSSRPFMHVGIDVNVPSGTPVFLKAPFQVLLVDDDNDSNGGWGPRVIGKQEGEGYIEIAHLENILCG